MCAPWVAPDPKLCRASLRPVLPGTPQSVTGTPLQGVTAVSSLVIITLSIFLGITNYEEYSLIQETIEEKKEEGTGTLKKDRTLLRDERKMEKLKAKLHTDDDCKCQKGARAGCRWPGLTPPSATGPRAGVSCWLCLQSICKYFGLWH